MSVAASRTAHLPLVRGFDDLDGACVNAIRTLAVDAVEQAGSGHPGTPLGIAPAAYVLWTRFLRHSPSDPEWPDRDRFVLSAGHASALLYSLLHLTGYDLPMGEIKRFRRWGSHTPGHPERGVTPGVETSTGPLGQGFANAVGMAIAEAMLARRYNVDGHRVVDHRTFALCSDGDMMEGISGEAASLAGHLGLGKLLVLYDDNGITIDGATTLAFTEDVRRRFDAYGWHTGTVDDGNDLAALQTALAGALAVRERPSMIAVRTQIGYGSPAKQGSAAAHGAPLGGDEVRRTKRVLGWPEESSFFVPSEVRARFAIAREQGGARQAEWRTRFARFAAERPDRADELLDSVAGRLPDDLPSLLPTFGSESGGVATRKASARVLEALAARLPALTGGSADLTESNGTMPRGWVAFTRDRPGSYIHFGVREQAMGGILNGLALHGGVRPYGGTFLVFSDYLRPAIRLAALMELPVVYVFTHDSIGLGEDGPTHQPVEHLAALRAIPGLVVIRPADANETAVAWRVALEQRRPVALCLTRQDLPVLDRSRFASAEGVGRGGYVLADDGGRAPELILIATGSEVHLALAACNLLEGDGIAVRVVGMPSWELFCEQPTGYRDEVLPPEVGARLAIEAASPMGWERWVGDQGDVVGLDRFGASAPGPVVYERLGFTPEEVARRARAVLAGHRPVGSP